jgi:hypothetical protein
MKHPSNRELFNYWNERRGERLAPERADIEPAAIRHVLGDTFVTEMSGSENHLFRIAGTRLCALFGRELKAESFLKLWSRTARPRSASCLRWSWTRRSASSPAPPGPPPTTSWRRSISSCCCCPLAFRSRNEARVMGALGTDGSALLARR